MSEDDLLSDIDTDLSALQRGQELGRRAATVGFDWPRAVEALHKVSEELDELIDELERDTCDPVQVRDELGDVLFAVTNVARKLDVDAEEAMEQTNRKFTRRFRFIERELERSGRTFSEVTLEEMERIWQRAKRELDDEGSREELST